MTAQKKVFVGLSGGVDSSVSAALLKEQGYDVVGVFIKVWQADFLPCAWREERRDAMRAAAHLGIPFLTLNLEKEYKKGVVDHMIREYGAGRVPNPDVMCNKEVKFGAFLEFAKKHGADLIATGHYARIEKGSGAPPAFRLLTGKDKEKDQSYFLWTLTQEQLAHALFPVGDMQKSEVRECARRFGLPNAEKKDSQGLCFMGPVDMADFLKHYLKTTKGDVLSEEGNIIGHHEGAMLYTIGQRHGFTTEKTSIDEEPYFVVAKDIEKNTLTVAHRNEAAKHGGIFSLTISNTNFISSEKFLTDGTPGNMLARIRYRGALYPVTLLREEGQSGRLIVRFNAEIEGISPGQSIVFYRDDECLGGGVIESISK